MLEKDSLKKIENLPNNTNEELTPISREYIEGLFENLGDDSNPIDYYTKQESYNREEIDQKFKSIDFSEVNNKIGANTIKISELEIQVNGVRANLYNNLISLGVEVNENDNLSVLASKVSELYSTNSKIPLDKISEVNRLALIETFTNDPEYIYYTYNSQNCEFYNDYMYWYRSAIIDSVERRSVVKINMRTNRIISEMMVTYNKSVCGIKRFDNILYLYHYKDTTNKKIVISRFNLDTESALPNIELKIDDSYGIGEYDSYTFDKVNDYFILLFKSSNSIGLKFSANGTVLTKVDYSSTVNYRIGEKSFIKQGHLGNFYVYSMGSSGITKIDPANLSPIQIGNSPSSVSFGKIVYNDTNIFVLGYDVTSGRSKAPHITKLDYELNIIKEFKGDINDSMELVGSYGGIYCNNQNIAMYYDKLYLFDNDLNMLGKTEYYESTYDVGIPYIFPNKDIYIRNNAQPNLANTVTGSIHKHENYYKILK